MVRQSTRSCKQNTKSLPNPTFLMVDLLPSNQTARNNIRSSLQTSIGFLLPLNTQFSVRTDHQNDSSFLPLLDLFSFDQLVDQGNQIGQSFPASCVCLDDTIHIIKQILVALLLNLGQLFDLISLQGVRKMRIKVEFI